jgi:hypothetical protein
MDKEEFKGLWSGEYSLDTKYNDGETTCYVKAVAVIESDKQSDFESELQAVLAKYSI